MYLSNTLRFYLVLILFTIIIIIIIIIIIPIFDLITKLQKHYNHCLQRGEGGLVL